MEDTRTTVIFRRYRMGGDVVALFPEIPGDLEPENCKCFNAIHRYGKANFDRVIEETEKALRDEYTPLMESLEADGHTLRVAYRISMKMTNTRLMNILKEMSK